MTIHFTQITLDIIIEIAFQPKILLFSISV